MKILPINIQSSNSKCQKSILDVHNSSQAFKG